MSDVEIVNEAFDWLTLVCSESRRKHVQGMQVEWNLGRPDPEERTLGCITAIGVGMSNSQNAELARAAMSALDDITDEAVLADVVGGSSAAFPVARSGNNDRPCTRPAESWTSAFAHCPGVPPDA
ncbi:MAG: hypothetical protein ACR2P2_15190 [Nakamurella sp.]